MSDSFRTNRRVEFADTDMAGIAHFSTFFRFMESAEHEYLRSRGLSVTTQHAGEKISFPRVSASCDFTKPIKFEDVVEVTVVPSRVGSKSVTYTFEFWHDGVVIAKGEMTSVCCRVTPGQPIEAIAIPEEIRAKLT